MNSSIKFKLKKKSIVLLCRILLTKSFSLHGIIKSKKLMKCSFVALKYNFIEEKQLIPDYSYKVYSILKLTDKCICSGNFNGSIII